jgi:hypothetical protein
MAVGASVALCALVLVHQAVLDAGQPLVVGGIALSLRPVLDLRWAATATALLLSGLTGALLGLRRLRPADNAWLLLRANPAIGDTWVSERVLYGLVAQQVRELGGVLDRRSRIGRHRKGWTVDCTVQLAEGAAPGTVGSVLQDRVSQELERQTGVPVRRVDVRLVGPAPSELSRVA